MLVARHVVFLRYALPHVRLSREMLALIVLIVIKHLERSVAASSRSMPAVEISEKTIT
jgi:hypothetical protein